MNTRTMLWGASLLVSGALVGPAPAAAHCDTMDGPVVKDARFALSKGDVKPILRWVRATDEPEIRATFRKTMAVRKQGPEARELADLYFYETLARVHRSGEGEPFDGLKPYGTRLEPGVAEADRAIASGSVDQLAKATAEKASTGVRARYARAMKAKSLANTSVAAGRRYVAAYVDFMHYVERLHASAAGSAPEHATAKRAADAVANQAKG